jgi:hypothetical protein
VSFSFAKPSSISGGTFFKPLDHMNDLALLIEPTSITKGVENTYQGRTTLRDEVTADVTVFGTSEALEKGEPTAVIKGARVVHGMLTSTLERVMGGAMVAVVRKIPTKNGSGYAFRDVEWEVEAVVGAYWEQREAAVDAARASGAMPSFD